MEYDEFITHFHVQKYQDCSCQCTCPAHDDQNPSLTISKGSGKILMHCHAGCNTIDILHAVGLEEKDMFSNSGRGNDSPTREKWQIFVEAKTGRRIEAIYHYHNEAGYTFTKIRLTSDENGDKHMRFGRISNDRITLGLGGKKVKEYNALYGNIADLKEAILSGSTVFIPEGEKDVDTLTARGYVAATYGSKNDWSAGLSEYFRGANVIILADNDDPGIYVARQVLKDIKKVAKTAKIVCPMPDTDSADITDYFDAGHTDEDFIKMISSHNNDISPKNASRTPNLTGQRRLLSAEEQSSLLSILSGINAAAFSWDDIGDARLFATVYKNSSRYNPTKKDYMFYDGKRWVLDRQSMRAGNNAKRLADALLVYASTKTKLGKMAKEYYVKHVEQLQQYRARNTMVADARDLNFFENEELDTNDFLLNCQNGVLDLSGDEPQFGDHNANLLLSKLSNVTYDPDATCPLWDKTVSEILEDDEDKIHYLQKLLGLALTGCTKEEELYFFYGSTSRNGKSTICETVLHLLGDYGTTISPETLAIKNNKDSRQASPDIAKLQGIRLVVASEPPKRMLFDTALVKTLTGRDSITARHLYESEFSFIPKFKLVLNTNYLPLISDDTVFKSERISILEFNRHFAPEEQNKDLKDQLLNELSGILNWMITGYYAYLDEGLNRPSAVKEATNAYRSDSDKIGQFLSECLTKSDENIPAGDVYNYYSHWCENSGYGVDNKKNFFAELKSKGIFASSGTVNGKTVHNILRGYSYSDNVSRDGFIPISNSSKTTPF